MAFFRLNVGETLTLDHEIALNEDVQNDNDAFCGSRQICLPIQRKADSIATKVFHES